MRLPVLLQPWAEWLTLLPDDLAGLLGALLLRLDPLVGPLRLQASARAIEPAGVGDIVRRGSYERLLISQWVYADSVPDEFIRRAANDELLFTGPEPAHHEETLRSVALFDAGPMQLGEPRLAHLALFILLARRAQAAGAAFEWGILQRPGVLHKDCAVPALERLLKARTHAVVDAAALAGWNAALARAPADCWLIGDTASPCPAPVQVRVHVRRAWLGDELEVGLAQRQRSTQVRLPLPPPAAGVRLLRRPFEATGPAAALRTKRSHSLKRAPWFSTRPEWLAVGTVDGGVSVYRMINSPNDSPGRPRTLDKLPCTEAIVAAGLCRKSFGTIARVGDYLHFAGFPGPFFGRTGPNAVSVPVPDDFQAVPGMGKWMPVFHFQTGRGMNIVEHVLVLGKSGCLVCWTSMQPGKRLRTTFRTVATQVIGAVQRGDKLLFAVGLADRTETYVLQDGAAAPAQRHTLMHTGTQFLFGDLKSWRNGLGLYALQQQRDAWLVGDARGGARVVVGENSLVLGCTRTGTEASLGLVVLEAGRKRIALHTDDERTVLVEAAEPIAQASFDALLGRLAWLGSKSGALTVRAIGADQPSLQTFTHGGPYDD